MYWSKTRNGLAILKNNKTSLKKMDILFFKTIRLFWSLSLLKLVGVAREREGVFLSSFLSPLKG